MPQPGVAGRLPGNLDQTIFRIAALAETVITGMTDFGADTGKVVEMPRRDWA